MEAPFNRLCYRLTSCTYCRQTNLAVGNQLWRKGKAKTKIQKAMIRTVIMNNIQSCTHIPVPISHSSNSVISTCTIVCFNRVYRLYCVELFVKIKYFMYQLIKYLPKVLPDTLCSFSLFVLPVYLVYSCRSSYVDINNVLHIWIRNNPKTLRFSIIRNILRFFSFFSLKRLAASMWLGIKFTEQVAV